MEYRREIDGLRAVAVVPVILFHAGMSVFSGGFVGVDVFFVISGYLITTILITELDNGNFSIARFYERRARRILPALFLVMFCCIPFAWMWMLPPELDEFSESLASVTFFISNVLFWRKSGYFEPDSHLRPLLHTWSLAVEEQYYILFPVLLLVLWRFGRKNVFNCIVTAAIASFLLCLWGARHAPVANFYLSPGRFWEILAGSICAFLLAGRRVENRNAASLAGLALVVFSIFYLDESTSYPGAYTLLPVVGTALIICFAGPGGWVTRLLGTSGFVGLGLISYSAYLWHQPLFAFARIRAIDEPSVRQILGLAALSLVLGWLSWRFVEQPFRRAGRGVLPTRKAIFAACAPVAAGLAALGVWGHVEKGFPARASVQPFAAIAYTADLPPYRDCIGQEPALGNLNMCKILPGAVADAALIGDSHADDKLYGLFHADKGRKWLLLANASCPPVLNIHLESDQLGCEMKMDDALHYVAENKAIKTVALSFFANYILTVPYAADHFRQPNGPDHVRITSSKYAGYSRAEMFLNGLQDTVALMREHGKEVIILMDQPELPFFPVDCIKGRPDCFVPRQQAMERQARYRGLLDRLNARFPSLRIFDPAQLFCDNSRCFYTRGETILYRDSHHLSQDGSAAYARQFLAWEAQDHARLSANPQ